MMTKLSKCLLIHTTQDFNMPYIKQEDRKKFCYQPVKLGSRADIDLVKATGGCCDTAGDLNYAFTVIVQEYLKNHGVNYQHLNDCIGALEGAKLELYRRVAAPYEDAKIEENGDVKRI